LFALPPDIGRDVAISAMGTLARLPWGGKVIDFLGHMRSPPELAVTVLGRQFSSPIGLGAELDPSLYALPALARFGVGFVEVGPITSTVDRSLHFIRRDTRSQSITTGPDYTSLGPDALLAIGSQASGLPRIVRVRYAPRADDALGNETWLNATAALAHQPHIAALSIDGVPSGEAEATSVHALNLFWLALATLATRLPPTVKLLLTLPPALSPERASDMVAAVKERVPSLGGVLITGGLTNEQGEYVWGAPARESAVALTRALRAIFPREQLAIIAGGGVHEPGHALELQQAGADLIKIDSGLIFTGPGLPKRCNEALLAEQAFSAPAARAASDDHTRNDASPARFAWFWMLLMGLAMSLGGLLALIIASTRVVLPYDEEFVNMTRAQLAEIPNLLAFMTHDRVTLAGTMLAIGVLYTSLAWYGVRRGEHWAWVAIFTSAMAGFLSFFSFLGFGYFEPFHAFVTAILFQFLLLAWHAPLPPREVTLRVPLVGDWKWKLSLWGQLGLVLESIAGLAAGAIIIAVGSTQVFVHEDLEFMGTCIEALETLEPKLLALVAHDRATFGGMLIACGLTTLMATLWGFMAGRRWLWLTLLAAGTIGYVSTLIVHHGVGYTSFKHLLPAYVGLLWHWLSLALAGPYLLSKE
jgi:hypothetical protein